MPLLGYKFLNNFEYVENVKRWFPTLDDRFSFVDEQCGVYGTGKLKKTDWLDVTFISQLPKLVEYMDKLTRICMKRAIEAVVGAINATKIYALHSLLNAESSMLSRSKTSPVNYGPWIFYYCLFAKRTEKILYII